MARESTRVALLGSFPPQTQGISGYCGNLATALARHVHVEAIGFKAMYPRLLFPGESNPVDPTASPPSASGLTVTHGLTWYNPLGWIWQAWRADVDIVHIQWWSLPLLPVCLTFAWVAKARDIPVVVTAHNVLPHEPNAWFSLGSRLLYGRATHIIVHSDVNLGQLLERFDCDPARVSSVPMGARGAGLEPLTPIEAKHRLSIPAERPVVLFFGIIRPYKGLDVLLKALARVRASHPDVLLLVAGKPWADWEPYEERIASLELENNVALHLGYVPENEVAQYFLAADLAVLPYTHFDAQSAVAVQALGFNLPTLVTRTGGLPELVGHDSRWCVEPNDPEALAAAITAFLDAPESHRAAFGALQDGLRQIGSRDASAEAHGAIYRAVLGKV